MSSSAAAIPLPSLVAALLIWALSELLVRRMRLVLPGILLSLFFIASCFSPCRPTSTTLIRAVMPAGLRGFWLDAIGATALPERGCHQSVDRRACRALYYWRFRSAIRAATDCCSLVLFAMALMRLVRAEGSLR